MQVFPAMACPEPHPVFPQGQLPPLTVRIPSPAEAQRAVRRIAVKKA
jgi:hypothetical protein